MKVSPLSSLTLSSPLSTLSSTGGSGRWVNYRNAPRSVGPVFLGKQVAGVWDRRVRWGWILSLGGFYDSANLRDSDGPSQPYPPVRGR